MKKMLCFFMLLALLMSCSKSPLEKPFTPGPEYNIPEEFKAWTVFRTGSWWVYKNEKTHVADTTKVTHGPFYNKEMCGNCPVIEYMWFYLKGPAAVMYNIEGGRNENATLSIMRDNFAEAMALTYKTIGDPTHSDSSSYGFTYELVEQMDSLTLNGNTIFNVLHTRITWAPYYYEPRPDLGFDYYFARGIGLILLRKNYTTTDTTWSVLSWNTIQ